MAKLRKMLGSVEMPEVKELMPLISSQSKATITKWACSYAKENYLPIFAARCDDGRIPEAIIKVEAHIRGELSQKELKPYLKEAANAARELSDDPIVQAAARAIAVACAVVQTPTNSLGYTFYGAAARAYSELGTNAKTAEYYQAASAEFGRILASLKTIAVENEPNPLNLDWNCD